LRCTSVEELIDIKEGSAVRWINFIDGTSYTFAADIQKFAERHGYKVPCEQDGTRHPGTDCNQKMRTIHKDAGMRRTFGVTESSVVVIRANDFHSNKSFLHWLVDNNIVSEHYYRMGSIQLYTREAVNALLSVMLKTHVEYEKDDTDEEWDCPLLVTKRNHNLEKKQNKPKASLFKR
jgi:hypothetical protein